MLANIFEMVKGILEIAGADPEAQGIVAQVFEFVLSIFGA